MTKWIADFEVEGHLCFEQHKAKVKYIDPNRAYEVHLKNLHTALDSNPPLLSAQVLLEAENIQSAAEVSKEQLREFLDILSFVTNHTFRIHAPIRVLDWTPGLTMRDFIQMKAFPGDDIPLPGLKQELLDTVHELCSRDIQPRLRRAFKWFAQGVRSTLLDDQFQYFWFAIELVAEIVKSPDPVPDVCQKCHNPLYCRQCEEISMHRPFNRQAIAQLISKVVKNDPDRATRLFLKVRNMLLHGDEIVNIEAEIAMPMSRVVNNIGKMAWIALLDTFKVEKPTRLNVIEISIYTHQTLATTLVGQMGGGGDPNNPQIEDFGHVKIEQIRDSNNDNVNT